MRVAVTGGMGFIGTEVVSLLERSGISVTIVDFWEDLLRSYESSRYPILKDTYGNISGAAELLLPDDFLRSLTSDPPFDAIVHLGAIVDTTDILSRRMVDLNVDFVRKMIDAANIDRSSDRVPAIILASSAATYGSDFTRPNNPYGLTKVLSEKIVSSTRGRRTSLRFFNVFGTNEHHKGNMASLPFKIAKTYREGGRFDVFKPFSSRDFISVSSVARVILSLVQSETMDFQPVYDVGTGKSTSIVDLDNFIMQATGSVTCGLREVPMPPSLEGRYQEFTCAGIGPSPVPVLGNDMDTRTGIMEQYGNR